MINSKKELKEYLAADAKALGFRWPLSLKDRIKFRINPRLRYHRLLRHYEYYNNLAQNLGSDANYSLLDGYTHTGN